MNYMFNINVCEISPLLLGNVALRMSNLQVIEDSSCWLMSWVAISHCVFRCSDT